MIDTVTTPPQNLEGIQIESEKISFPMPSDLLTGSLLRTLTSSKPNGSFLELGTGTGLALSWIVAGMDMSSSVISIDNEKKYLAIAEKFFADDKRVTIVCEDGNSWIKNNKAERFDLIFADAWPGKYETLDETLLLLKKGGFYIIDDMLPQSNWPPGHQSNVNNLIRYLESHKNIQLTKLNWSTGIIIITKVN